MAKQQKKSIADLIGKRKTSKPSVAEIEDITQKIHTPSEQSAPSDPPVTVDPPKQSPPKRRTTRTKITTKKAVTTDPTPEKIKRISVNAPVSLYLKAKTKATLADQTLMGYILELMEKDLK